ncbi:MAG: hypothetical protein WC736_14665 [Gallionella sp.]|jgi:uncharacterized protein YbdZ (MbtH family)
MKLTREILEQAKSDMGGYSDAQFSLIGIFRPIPKGWRKKVVAQEFPDADIAKFVELKNKHLTPAIIKKQLDRKARNKAKREADAEALAHVGLPQISGR